MAPKTNSNLEPVPTPEPTSEPTPWETLAEAARRRCCRNFGVPYKAAPRMPPAAAVAKPRPSAAPQRSAAEGFFASKAKVEAVASDSEESVCSPGHIEEWLEEIRTRDANKGKGKGLTEEERLNIEFDLVNAEMKEESEKPADRGEKRLGWRLDEPHHFGGSSSSSSTGPVTVKKSRVSTGDAMDWSDQEEEGWVFSNSSDGSNKAKKALEKKMPRKR
jgi:hypothetical protein